MFRILTVVLVMLPGLALAQDRAQTLADIRAEIASLSADFNALKQELVATGAAGSGAAGGSALQRMDAIEAALVQLTGKTEQVELRLNKVVTDGTNRVGDLEFRLTELEGGDVGALAPTTPLGGDAGTVASPLEPVVDAPAAAGGELAVSEQADFDRAKGVLGQGDFRTAADLFATFAQSYPGGPLVPEAHYLRGEALRQSGQIAPAARAYLTAYNSAPDGAIAQDALLKLGEAFGQLGETQQACLTLQQLPLAFPASQAASQATIAMQGLGCS